MNSRLICLIGPDGTGKTTQAKALIDEFKKEGVICQYRWMRFLHFFSLPILAWARIAGLSEEIILPNGNLYLPRPGIDDHYYTTCQIYKEPSV